MSALRHQLRKIVGSEKADYGEDIKEYLKRQDDDEKRFERDLSVMIGCVSPRSLTFNDIFQNERTSLSATELESLSARFKIIYFLKITIEIDFINQSEIKSSLTRQITSTFFTDFFRNIL